MAEEAPGQASLRTPPLPHLEGAPAPANQSPEGYSFQAWETLLPGQPRGAGVLLPLLLLGGVKRGGWVIPPQLRGDH